MGALNLLHGRTVYLDASIIIYVVEHSAKYSALLRPLMEAAELGEIILLSSELTILETMILPLRSGDEALIQVYEDALFESDLRLAPISREILTEAARLRAQHSSLRTPDAIHWATMRVEQADYLLTNDAQFAKIVGASAVYLDDLL